jgi:hypothetical protein
MSQPPMEWTHTSHLKLKEVDVWVRLHVLAYPLGFKSTKKVLLAPNQIKELYLHLRED